MPFELQIIRASEFVRFDAHEQPDLEASKEVLRSMAHACRKRGLDCALLDLRMLPIPEKPLFTANDLAALVGVFLEAGFGRQQRLAILYRLDVHGGIHNFSFISRMRGLQVLAFNEFEEALIWLSEAEHDAPEDQLREIPVHIAKPSAKPKVRVRRDRGKE